MKCSSRTRFTGIHQDKGAALSDNPSEAWRALRERVSREAIDSKDSQSALSVLAAEYVALAPREQAEVDAVLREWLASSDEGLRFDAVGIIYTAGISYLAPSLGELANRLRGSDAPSAPYELAKVERVLNMLSSRE